MSNDKFRRNLYFYQWDRKYMSTAQNSFRISCSIRNFEYDDDLDDFQKLRNMGVEVYAYLPVLWKEEGRLSPKELGSHVDGIYIGNIGQINWGKKTGKPLMADAGLNIYNGEAAKFYLNQGFKGTVISYELDPVEKDFFKVLEADEAYVNAELEILRFGRVPAMVSEYCPLAGAEGVKGRSCGKCMEHNPVYLKDGRGERYPVILDDSRCTSAILSKDSLNRKNSAKVLKGWKNSIQRITVFDESPSFISRI
ncbi:MAG: U32 family peptidase [Firmicutes bacterium]|nr:U32 family peptidase [Bacillota bacterium]